MLTLLTILWNSFKMAVQELRVNKLRTSLSLFGITIGIICIISVKATIDSLEGKIQSDIKALGSNTIYIDKWDYGGGPDYPWWKYISRPKPQFNEIEAIKSRSTLAAAACYFQSTNEKVKYVDAEVENVGIYCATEDFNKIQTIKIGEGRYLSEAEFSRGVPAAVVGYEVATLLFGKAEKAIGKTIMFHNRVVAVVGVVEKQGSTMLGDGFDYDNALIIPYRYYASIYDTRSDWSGGFIMVQGKPNVDSKLLISELRGIMRQIRRLSPTSEDNFSLNDINLFSDQVSGLFATVNMGGAFISGISLIVGMFGVANIMFVTVRERTSQIGLKKAIGAKRSVILLEFLMESAFLCIIGGAIGLFIVWLGALAASAAMPFSIVISGGTMFLAFSICLVIGVIAGIIPASVAAKMDPVVAIRTK